MANVNLGFLGFNAPPTTRFGFLQRQGLGIRTDTYAFETGSITANVAVSVSSASSEKIALVLFKDNNKDSILNSGDTVVANAGSGGTFQAVNSTLTKGNYIARLTSVFDTGYTARFARGTTGTANPLAAPEIPLGTIDKDLTRRGQVNDQDTADNFAFTLGASGKLNIGMKEIGNLSGDANIRVIRDLDGDGAVDSNEIVAKGVSSLKGNAETISGLQGAGDYILQVCQSKGNTNFEVKFDYSAA